MRNRTLLISACLIVGIAGYGVYRFGGSPARAEHASGDTARLAEQVAQLKSQVESLHTRKKPHGPRTASPVKPLDRAQQKERWKAYMAKVEKEFLEEPRDPNWATATTSILQEKLRAIEGMRSAVRKLECRSRTCRLEMLVDGAGKFEDALPDFLMGLGSTVPNMRAATAEEPNGQKVRILYLSAPDPAQASQLARR